MAAQRVQKRSKTLGGEPFYGYVDGDDLETAFRGAVDVAEYEHGLDSAFAGKDTVVVIEDEPVSEASARTLAKSLVETNDTRIADSWGPFGAIAVGNAFTVTGWLLVGLLDT